MFYKNSKFVLLLVMMLTFSVLVAGCGGDILEETPAEQPENIVEESTEEDPEGGEVAIGSKNFTESVLLANIFAVMIEENTNVITNVQELGGTMVAYEALLNDDIQLYPEYTGTGFINMLERTEILSAEETYEIVQQEFRERWNLKWMQPLGFNNTYTLALRQTMIDELGLTTFSDLLDHDEDLVFGVPTGFTERQDGLPGLVNAYGFEFGDVVDMDPGLMYTAVQSENVDIISAFATDGRIPAYDLGVLEDDQGFFPPYYAAPLIRNDVLEQYPQLEILNKLLNVIDDETMAELNFRVDEMAETEDAVARDFLSSIGLI